MNVQEQELIEQCLVGNRSAQAVFYEKYAPRMYLVTLRYCQEESLAQDALQEGFVRAFRFLDQFRGQSQIEFWLKKIMVNTSLRLLEKQKKKLSFELKQDMQQLSNQPGTFENDVLLAVNIDHILVAIQNLPDGFRTIFNLFAIEGYSHKEIAEMLGISEGTSKSQYARARARLQQTLMHLYPELIS